MIEEPALVAELQAELEDTRRVRDQWCAEYTALRDDLKLRIERMESLIEQIALGLGVKV